jgi:hypothetical protein
MHSCKGCASNIGRRTLHADRVFHDHIVPGCSCRSSRDPAKQDLHLGRQEQTRIPTGLCGRDPKSNRPTHRRLYDLRLVIRRSSSGLALPPRHADRNVSKVEHGRGTIVADSAGAFRGCFSRGDTVAVL